MTQDILMSHYEQPVASNDAARNQLQQFCILAKTAQGAAILELVRQVLEAPNIYVFAELIEMPNIAALKDGADVKYWNTLNLFAYGTHKQYRKNPSEFIELSPAMLKKLQQLTIVSLAIEAKCIPYDVLLAELEIDNVRHLEDVIIEAIYANIIHGKLFQNNRFLEIDYAQGRDIPPGFTSKIATTLQNWVDSCDTITNCIDEQIRRANAEKAKRLKNTEHVERTVQSLKKVLKNSQSETDDAMQVEEQRDHMSMSVDPRKKSLKTKQSRPSSKLSSSLFGGGPTGSSGQPSSSSSSATASWFKSFTQSFDKE